MRYKKQLYIKKNVCKRILFYEFLKKIFNYNT